MAESHLVVTKAKALASPAKSEAFGGQWGDVWVGMRQMSSMGFQECLMGSLGLAEKAAGSG